LVHFGFLGVEQKAFLNALEVVANVERRRTADLGLPPRNVLRELARTPKQQVTIWTLG
jgi:hypothetical protein